MKEVFRLESITGPHRQQPVYSSGAAMEEAKAAIILAHGRGASAEDILQLAELVLPPGMAALAPDAAGGAWYPQRFMAPLESNEPWLSSSLEAIGAVLARLGEAGIPPGRTVLAGFSQGACLALEYAARHPQRYGAVVGLSGGLIGPDGPRPQPAAEGAALLGTPVFLGCSDVDYHIPAYRVEEAAAEMKRLGGEVTVRFYRGMGHTVNEDELLEMRRLLSAL